MKLFRHKNRERSEQSRRTYAMFELVRTAVDFLAAMFFLIGSVMFFWNSLQTVAIWFFVIGSACFAAKPTLKLAREIKLARQGEYDDLAGSPRPRP